MVRTAPVDAAPEPAAGLVGSATGVPYVVPAGTRSLEAIFPVFAMLM